MNHIIVKLSILLLATAVLATSAWIMIAVQQMQITNLKNENRENLQLLKDFQDKQYQFDKAIVERLND